MNTYFICNVDSYGQRTGTYTTIQLSESDIKIDNYGNKLTNEGRFLYDNEIEVIRACQD
jgi:hypothetical protein